MDDVRRARKLELEKERQKILHERARLLSLNNKLGLHVNLEKEQSKTTQTSSSSSRSSAIIQRTMNKIPEFERELQGLRKRDELRSSIRKPYKGEMGIGSYEPWQLEDVYFIREFVASWVDEVLDYIERGHTRRKKQRDTANIAESLLEVLEADRRKEELFQLSLDIERSIVTDVIREAARETAEEIMELWIQTNDMLHGLMLDSLSLQPQSQDTQNKDALLSNALLQIQKEARKKGSVWSHSQAFVAKDTPQGSVLVELEERDTFDGTVLHFHEITPYNNLPDASLLPEQVDFQNKESEFWMGNTAEISVLPLPRRYKGISCSAVASDNSLIALGTVQGDILIWDLLPYPPRILRTSRGRNTVIMQLQWSLDKSQVVSVDNHGSVVIWSLSNTTSVPYDVKSFEPIEQNLVFKPTDLLPALTLASNNFIFTEGPFSESSNSASKATAVAFHPSVSLLGKESYLMVGLNNGNILRVKYRSASSVMSIPPVKPTNGTPHKISQDLEAELFKSHQNPIILISFANNVSPMVTVDDKGFINLWYYSQECLSGFGWFVPSIRYRLDMSEVTYEPVLGAQPQVEFTDASRGQNRKQPRVRQETIQNRERVSKYISSLRLGKQWKTEEKDDKITHVYIPKSVPESGANFHCLTYHVSSGLLASYVTRPYRPVKVPCSRFVSCQVNSSGSKLVFMLLFPDADPKEAHVSFVTVKLEPSVVVSKNYINIPVGKNDYTKCLRNGLAFGLSRPIDATGSEYIVANINGNLTSISMTSGNDVIGRAERGGINIKKGLIPSASKVQVASMSNRLQFLLYSPGYNSAVLLQLTDSNTREQRMRTWRAFQKWALGSAQQNAERTLAPLQTIRRVRWTFDGHSDVHVECFMESLVYELIDDAIQTVDGPFSEDQRRTFHAENMEMPFLLKVIAQNPEENDPGTTPDISQA